MSDYDIAEHIRVIDMLDPITLLKLTALGRTDISHCFFRVWRSLRFYSFNCVSKCIYVY